jgi:hypothetical protein
LFNNHFWLERGADGLLRWSFTTGSLTAAACALAAVLALRLTYRKVASWETLVNRNFAVFARTAIALSLCFWILGVLVTV